MSVHCLCIRGGVNRTHVESKCPELLANYCDLLLRKSPYSKKLTSEEVETRLKQVVGSPCCVYSHTHCALLFLFPYSFCHATSFPYSMCCCHTHSCTTIVPSSTHSYTHFAMSHPFPYPVCHMLRKVEMLRNVTRFYWGERAIQLNPPTYVLKQLFHTICVAKYFFLYFCYFVYVRMYV